VEALALLQPLARGIALYKQNYETFKKRYPFLCSKKKSKPRRFPSEILPGKLYLGDMKHAKNIDALQDLGVSFILTIFNERPQLKVDARTFDWLYLEAHDSERQDLTKIFDRAVKFLTRAIDTTQSAAYVHCGKGVSRSASLVIAYLMKSQGWSLNRALKHAQSCRPIVNPNAGFSAQLREWIAKVMREEELKKAAEAEPEGTEAAEKAALEEEWKKEVGLGGAKSDQADAETTIPYEMIQSLACKPRHTGARFVVYKSGERQSEEIELGKRPMYTIGRGDEQRVKLGRSAVDLRFMHPSLSRKHALLIHDSKGHLLIYDAHSSHGTYLDGKRLRPGECWRVNNGQRLKFGSSTREYELTGAGSRWDDDEEEEELEPRKKKGKWDD